MALLCACRPLGGGGGRCQTKWHIIHCTCDNQHFQVNMETVKEGCYYLLGAPTLFDCV